MGRYRDVNVRGKKLASERWFRRPILFTISAVVVLLIGITLFFLHSRADAGPVPDDVRKQVNFAIYYPRQQKLPSGYNLDTTSFRLAQSGVIIYSVTTGNQKLIFSEEQSPGGNVVDKFTSDYIPLHNTVTTPLGKALVGSVGQGANLQTIASMPINNGPWLIITAPASTKQSDIQQIIQSLTK